MVQFFIHCLVRANHKTQNYKGIEIEPGSFISGRKVLSEETGLSEQQTRTCITRLKSTKELTSTPTKGIDGVYTLYTLCNWQKHQTVDMEQPAHQPAHQPQSNQASTTNKNVKNEKEIYSRVITHLNNKAKKNFKEVESNTKLIAGRLSEGYTEQDIISVIDKKIKDKWFIENPKYLRPETLFNATKFQTYIQETESKPKYESTLIEDALKARGRA